MNQERLVANRANVVLARALISSADSNEANRGREVLRSNHKLAVQETYVIGQLKWRLGWGDPTEELRQVVIQFAEMVADCRRYGVPPDTYWAHLVAFVAVILSGGVPQWLAEQQADLSSYVTRKTRLKQWEINLGYQTALALTLHTGELPEYWARFLSDSEGGGGLKRIRTNIVTYEALLKAVSTQAWDDVPRIMQEVDANYRKRGSSEASYADVFGDGPYNSRSIDYIAAALLRPAQNKRGFPFAALKTPHLWGWGDCDLSGINPH